MAARYNESMNVGNKIGTRRSVRVGAPPGGNSSISLGHVEADRVVWEDRPDGRNGYVAHRDEERSNSCPFGVNAHGTQRKNLNGVRAAANERLRDAPFVTDASETTSSACDFAPGRQHFQHQAQRGSAPWEAPGTQAGHGRARVANPRGDAPGILTWEEPERRTSGYRQRPEAQRPSTAPHRSHNLW